MTHATVPEVGPRELLDDRSVFLVDVREREERDAFGWIPGTVWMPASTSARSLQGLAASKGERPLVLTCMTGRRTEAWVERLAPIAARPVCSLRGGLLAWTAEGLPVCAANPALLPARLVDELPEGPIDPERFRRELLACFLGASMSTVEDLDAPSRVAARVLSTFDGSAVSAVKVVERLAARAWSQGHDLELIVRNVSYFHRLAAALPSTP